MPPILLRHKDLPNNDLPNIYKTSLIISNDQGISIGDGVSSIEASSITSIGTYQSNLYVGSSNGTIQHYHLFEDAPEYMLISEVPVSTSNPVTKILILKEVEKALILSGSVVSVYSLPEMSPMNIGKLKEVNDIHILDQLPKATDTGPSASAGNSTSNNVIIFTSNKIRIVSVGRDSLKLISDVSYTNAITGVPIKSSSSSSSSKNSNSSNKKSLALVANKKNYDIIDLVNVRKIPLFEYNQGTDDSIVPIIVPFYEENNENGKQEYMLTIRSDQSTSIAMFIDSRGNVTRGTLSWVEATFPDSIIIDWPYAIGVFGEKIIISSIKTFEVEYEGKVADLLGMETQPEETTEEGEKEKEVIEGGSEVETQLETNTASEPTDSIERGQEEPDSGNQNNEETETKDADTSKEVAESETNSVKVSNQNTNSGANQGEDISKEVAIPIADDIKPKKKPLAVHIKHLSEQLKIVDNSFLQSLVLVDTSGTQITSNSVNDRSPSLSSKTLVYNSSQIWILHKENALRYAEIELKNILSGQPTSTIGIEAKDLFELLQKDNEIYKDELLQFKTLLLFLLSILSDSNETLDILLTQDSDGKLLIDPTLVLFLLDKDNSIDHSELYFFSSIFDLITLMKFEKRKNGYQGLLIQYLRSLYVLYANEKIDKRKAERFGSFDRAFISKWRLKLYHNDSGLRSSDEIIKFIDTYDEPMFKNTEQDSCNKSIRSYLDRKHNYLALIHIYELSLSSLKPAAKSIIAEEICRIILKLLKGEIVDVNFDNEKDKEGIIDTFLSQLRHIYNEKVYPTYLLEILKFNPEKSMKFMKSNNSTPKFKSIHKHIMQELNTTTSPEISLLKIEYLESIIQEARAGTSHDISAIDDLLLELFSRGQTLSTDLNINNFNVLQETYKIENRLNDPVWPKISWIDYLSINSERSECKTFAQNYLKIFELLLLRRAHTPDTGKDFGKMQHSLSTLIEANPTIYSYFKLILQTSISDILETSDYTTAEFYSIHGSFPHPRRQFYSKLEARQLQIQLDAIRANLTKVFEFYIKQNDNFAAIRHFIESYGTCYFSTLEILSMLPDSVPVVQIQEYLTDCLIELGAVHRSTLAAKVVSRSNEKFIKKTLKEYKEEEQEGN